MSRIKEIIGTRETIELLVCLAICAAAITAMWFMAAESYKASLPHPSPEVTASERA